ncbi:MAG: hypothetical protein QOH81_3498 [Sphingomonadales bacterium]|jgi:hypothetical protein|nr:hypothetical protein [Sphingomonadales bacterium]
MKAVMFAAALLVGTAAYAQGTTGTQGTGAMAGGTTVAPSNAAPKRDARGVPVISADATAPAGWNQPPGTPGAAPASAPAPTMGTAGDLPPCSRKVTDHCTQTYERNHGPAGGAMAATASTGTDATATADAGTDTAMSAGAGGSGKKAVRHRRRARR